MKYDIIRTPGSLIDLRSLVEHAISKNGWTPNGAPFRDVDERQWCQAMTGPATTPADEVRLREPKPKAK